MDADMPHCSPDSVYLLLVSSLPLHVDNVTLQSRLCLHGCVPPLPAIDGRHQSSKWQFLVGVNQVAGG